MLTPGSASNAVSSNAVLKQLRCELASDRLITDPDVMEGYRRDQTAVLPAGQPIAVVRAGSVRDVVATMRWATAHRVPVVPRGGGTGLVGDATTIDECVILSLGAMDRIVDVTPRERLAVVEPGVINADLDRAARAKGLMYPPDPSSYEISTIGGRGI